MAIFTTFGSALRATQPVIRVLFCSLEDFHKKANSKRWSINSNQVCISEELLSHYTKFKLFDREINSTNETIKYRKYLIEHELKNAKRSLSILEEQINLTKGKIDCFYFDDVIKTQIDMLDELIAINNINTKN